MKKMIDGETLIEAIRGLMRGEESGTGLGLPAVGSELIGPMPGKSDPKFVLEPKGRVRRADAPALEEVVSTGAGSSRITQEQLEKIYRQFRDRLLDELPSDPVFLQVLAQLPEICIEIKPRLLTVDGSTLRGRVALLISRGFFDSPKRQGEARTELTRTGSEPNSGQLSTLFSEFVVSGFFERAPGDRYIRGAGLKITEKLITAAS